ncbi:hypothetical protein CPB85DRAFT_396747 [Mucidula mucida]|nr:hypothetical protein CPB85DRAFT_396747 [Mucidula mucida]
MANISLLTEGEVGSTKLPIAPMRRCGKVGCPFSCDCQSIDLFDDPSRLLSSVTQVASHATGGHQYLPAPTAVAQAPHAHTDLPPDASIQPGPSAPVSGRSGLSLTAPPSNQREKHSHSTSSSRVSTRPVTPEGEIGTSVTKPRTIPPPPGRMPSYHVVNPRLQDISAAESARSSSSLPNISMSGSHFPASLSSKQFEADASSSSKSRSGSPHRSSAARAPRADLSVTPIKELDNRLSSGSQPRSTASEAAKALERQHRERERKEKAGDGESSRGRRAMERASPKSVESNALDSSRPRSRSSRREEGSGSTRSRTKVSRSEASTYAPPISPGQSRMPTNIYAPVAPIAAPTWTYAQSQSQHTYQSKGKMMAQPATATLAS